jgi:hypothetical protein
LLIPAAYRSLSRPSSPLRAKASPVYPFLLSSTRAPFAPHGMLFDRIAVYRSFVAGCKLWVASINAFNFQLLTFNS